MCGACSLEKMSKVSTLLHLDVLEEMLPIDLTVSTLAVSKNSFWEKVYED